MRVSSFAIFVLLIISFSFSAYADQSFYLKTNENSIKAVISKTEITRISFLSDIESIHTLKGEIEYEIVGKDLYLRANIDKPINFFIKIASGKIYKFIASVENIPAQQIFIRSQALKSREQSCQPNYKVKGQ